MILDTAHLAAVDGDPVEIVEKYHMGKGNIGLDNIVIMKALILRGFFTLTSQII